MTMPADANLERDPVPQPPPQPALEDCCRSGCTPCVFDLYEEALDRYRAELRAWQARNSAPTNSAEPALMQVPSNAIKEFQLPAG